MRSVAITATLLAAFWLPASASAQDPDPAPPQAMTPARAERPARAPETRAPEKRMTEGSQSPSDSTRAVNRDRARDSQATSNNRRRDTATATDDGGQGRTAAAPATSTSAMTDASEEQRSGGQRRGAMRRPDGDSGNRGGTPGGATTRDRAVPRGSVPAPRQTRVFVYPDYYRYYNRYYDPWGYGGFGLGYFYYSPWAWNSGYPGPGYGYGYGSGSGSGYGYGHGGGRYYARGYDIGSLKLKVDPSDAEVFVDGYFAGNVDDFDGVFQSLKLDSGNYRIEVRKAGYQTLQFDVRVQPERTITFRGELRPLP